MTDNMTEYKIIVLEARMDEVEERLDTVDQKLADLERGLVFPLDNRIMSVTIHTEEEQTDAR